MNATPATMATMESFAYQRGLPATTCMYAKPTRTAVSAATGCEGEGDASQWPDAVTPKGRGRWARLERRSKAMMLSVARLTRKTTRCRKRRKTTAIAAVRRPQVANPHRDPTELRLLA